MNLQASTLQKLHALEVIYQEGYHNAVVDRIVDKMVLLEREQAQHDLTELQQRLRTFETHYQMESETFYTRFQNGELGDDTDFFEWSALLNMHQSVLRRLQALAVA
jgi:hypothetical protein